MNSRFATKGQVEYALKLGAIKEAADGISMTRRQISRLIESAKQDRFQDLCRTYDELDADLQRSGDILSITEKATELKKQGYSNWYCGPCPECGGKDRFYINTRDNLFKCGHSSGGNGCGWGGGIAQMAAYVFRCSTWDAIDYLTGQSPRSEPIRTKMPIRPLPRQEAKVDDKPYLDASSACEASIRHLWAPDGQAGRDYLSIRGITEDTMLANRVGAYYSQWSNARSAVCFPHELILDGQMQVISLNRRFLDDGKPKTKHISGGRWGLYHLERVYGAKTLIVIEGEINGLSIWQEVRQMGLLVDVISVGSEGAFKKLAGHISRAAKNYESLVIWADSQAIAQQATRLIKHPSKVAMHSQTGRKGKAGRLARLELDANELLSLGLLSGLLSRLQQKIPSRKVPSIASSKSVAKPPIFGIQNGAHIKNKSSAKIAPCAPEDFHHLLNDAGWALQDLHGDTFDEGARLYKKLEDAFMDNDYAAALNVHAQIKSDRAQQAWDDLTYAQRPKYNALHL